VYLLDSDILSLYLGRLSQYPRLEERVLSTEPEQLSISVISVEEAWKGALNLVQRNRLTPQALASYAFMIRVHERLTCFQVLPYDAEAERIYRRFSPGVRRLGTQDCRIAAIAISRRLTVITRNAQHFSQIPGVAYEDWSR
jgi:tRNA(fMet)-specific endonuclease VapC